MEVVDKTLEYYQKNADLFVEGTVSVDMHDAQMRFLRMLLPHAYILDFGCGSGRDAKAFLDQGHLVDAVDGPPELCSMASELIGKPLKQMLFDDLSVSNQYDGIWACASILHLPRRNLVDVLPKISNALKTDGVLYASFKYGSYEGMRDGRYFTDFTEESLGNLMDEVPSLLIVDTWITDDVRPEREERWINTLARRI